MVVTLLLLGEMVVHVNDDRVKQCQYRANIPFTVVSVYVPTYEDCPRKLVLGS